MDVLDSRLREEQESSMKALELIMAKPQVSDSVLCVCACTHACERMCGTATEGEWGEVETLHACALTAPGLHQLA